MSKKNEDAVPVTGLGARRYVDNSKKSQVDDAWARIKPLRGVDANGDTRLRKGERSEVPGLDDED